MENINIDGETFKLNGGFTIYRCVPPKEIRFPQIWRVDSPLMLVICPHRVLKKEVTLW